MPGLTPPDQTTIDTWQVDEAVTADGSPKVSFDRTGSIATRQVLCLWDYRYHVARWFVGESDYWEDGSTLRLTRLVPQKLPRPVGVELDEWVPDFYATKIVSIEGHAWDGNDPGDWRRLTADGSITTEPMPAYQFTEDTVNRYLLARITIQYERLPFEVKTDEEVEGGTEAERWVQYITKQSPPDYITVPSSTQRTIDPAGVSENNPPGHLVPVPYPVGLTESSYRFALKWCRLNYAVWGPGSPLFAKIMGDGTPASTYLNAINLVPFFSLPIGTVMLEEVTDELVPVMLDRGLMAWDLTFHFWFKPGGHNSQYFFPIVTEHAAAGNLVKRMFVGRGTTYYAPGSVPDLVANYVEKDLYELFNIDGG